MESFYLLDYLKENSELNPKHLNILKYELDKRLYYYGNHFKYPFEKNKKSLSNILNNYLKIGYTTIKILQNNISNSSKERVFSNAYFTVNKELSKLGYEVYSPSWHFVKDGNIFPDLKVYLASRKISSILNNGSFHDIIADNFISEINKFEESLISAFQKRKIKAVILPNDVAFFEKILINVSKKLDIPSIIFLHGLPARYNIIDENQTDYLIVWGKKIKDNYINCGFQSNKIFVSGHPYYPEKVKSSLIFSMNNILVLTKTMNGGQHSDKVRLTDRGNSILYLLTIEKVLRNLGVKSVRLRTHPSENINWYYQFISKDFFISDKNTLKKSINSSSMIIGPTSTVFLESIYYGRNYIVYEPSIDGVDLCKYNLAPPFDKSDSRVPVATNETELTNLLENKMVVDQSIFSEYIKNPFDISFIREII